MTTKPEQLDELNLKQIAVNAAIVGTTALAGYHHLTTKNFDHRRDLINQDSHETEHSDPKRLTLKQHIEKVEQRSRELTTAILSKYKIEPKKAEEIAELAMRYEQPVFPKAEDILSIISIESSFNPNAVSSLKTDPAIGLMQVRPGIWGLDADALKGDIDEQVKTGVRVLVTYYQKLNNVEAAVHAYNIGITNFKKQEGLNPAYVEKFKRARSVFE